MEREKLPQGFQDTVNFGLVQAILGRSSRRANFSFGSRLPYRYDLFQG